MTAQNTPPTSTNPDPRAQPQLPASVLYYGSTQVLPQSHYLRAGPLSAVFQMGDLRYIRWGKHEILRRIYVAVRDHNWDTIPGHVQDLHIESRRETFAVTFTMIHQQGNIHFTWEGEIRGRPTGDISYSMAGQALSGFQRNRIGICVLHPASCAGIPCQIEHATVGSTDETEGGAVADTPLDERAWGELESCFPQEISPHQPFMDIQTITHLVDEIDAKKIVAEVQFTGDVFEMEDQRNWTDASFKTYSTPLALPYPVQVEAGEIVEQSIAIRLRTDSDQLPTPDDAQIEDDAQDKIVELTLAPETTDESMDESSTESTRGLLPSIGLGLASHGESLSMTEIDRLRQLAPAHLRVDLYPQSRAFVGILRDAWREAAFLGAQLEAALFLAGDNPDQVAEQLAHVARATGEFNPDICRWLIFHQNEASTTDQWVALARDVLSPITPEAKFITGTNAYFTELNRGEAPTRNADGVIYSINPQVHAFDLQSLVETLETQATTVTSARAFSRRHLADALPVYVSPVTLRPRFNPNATGPEPEPEPGELSPQIDPRQMSLFGAGWTLGSIKYLAQARAAAVTYYETTGPQGVMERASGSPAPNVFRSLPGAVFPLYHVLADIGEYRGAHIRPIQSEEPLIIEGFALQTEDGYTRIMLANYTEDTRTVKLKGLPGKHAALRRLDKENVLFAMTEPEEYRRVTRDKLAIDNNTLELALPPFGLACLDIEPQA